MSRDFDPVPEERGDLQPPRRRPPTAVGTATLPPLGPRTPPGRRRRWPMLGVAAFLVLSPLLLGLLSQALLRNAGSRWTIAAGALAAVVAAALALVLIWVAVVVPIRDFFRARAANRLIRA